MSLPLLRGYPMVLAVHPAAINARYQQLAHYDFLPTAWEAHGPSWQLTATVAVPYLSVDPAFPDSVVLNLSVQHGAFTASIVEDEVIGKKPYPLDGVVFRIITPTQLLRENATDTNVLVSLLLQLDAPHVATIVETSQAIVTEMPDGLQVQLAARVQDYVQGLAQTHQQAFIVAGSLVAVDVAAASATQPTQARFSLLQAGTRSSLSWLYLLRYAPDPTSPEAGHFGEPLLDEGQQAVYVIHSYALINSLIAPAVAGALGIAPASFRGWDDAALIYPGVGLGSEQGWRNGFVLKVANIYPAGDHVQVDCRAEQVVTQDEKVLGITVSSVTLTTTLTWSLAVSFINDDGVVKPTTRLLARHAEQHSSSSILGIPFPGFMNGLLDELLQSLTPGMTWGTSVSLSAGLQKLAIPGGGTLNLQSVAMRDGNLRLALQPSGFSRFAPGQLTTGSSLRSDEPVSLTIHNHTDQRLTVNWLDYQGQAVAYPAVAADSVSCLNSFVTHVFSIQDEAGSYQALYRLDAAGPIAIHLFRETLNPTRVTQ